MRPQINLDLSLAPDAGKRYEDTYGGWMVIFQRIAEAPEQGYVCDNVPPSWASLVYYLGGEVRSIKPFFPEDQMLDVNMTFIQRMENRGMLRELVESHSTLRPELVDSLYQSDMHWDTKGRRHKNKKEFKVTNNGSFFRPEVLEYLNTTLMNFEPGDKRRCLLVPCAADKPYPAPMHTAVRESIPNTYELIIATGVLGLVPESLWGAMPLYDSGMPYEWRLMMVVEWFFSKFKKHYDFIAVYCDFYSVAIQRGLQAAKWPEERVLFILPPMYYDKYVDLMDEGNLSLLSENTHEYA